MRIEAGTDDTTQRRHDATTTTKRRGRRRGDDDEATTQNVATEMMPPKCPPRRGEARTTTASLPLPGARTVAAAPKSPAAPQPRCSARALTIAAAPGLAAATQVLTVCPPSRVSGGGAGDRGVRIASTGGEGGGLRMAVRITDHTTARRPALLVGWR